MSESPNEPLRWNWSKRRTEPVPERISRSKARRLRKQRLKDDYERRKSARDGKAARMDSGIGADNTDFSLIEESVIGGWGVGNKIRQLVTARMVKHVLSDDTKASIAASRVLVRIDERQQQALTELEKKNAGGGDIWPSMILPELIANGLSVDDATTVSDTAGASTGAEANAVTPAAGEAPSGGDSGDVCQDGQPGPLEADAPSANP